MEAIITAILMAVPITTMVKVAAIILQHRAAAAVVGALVTALAMEVVVAPEVILATVAQSKKNCELWQNLRNSGDYRNFEISTSASVVW